MIEKRLSIGMVILRIITTEESEEQITSFLVQENCGATSLDAQGSRGSVKMVISLVNRADVPRITEFIRTVNSRAFFSIEDVRDVNEGVFRPKDQGVLTGVFRSVLHKKRNNCPEKGGGSRHGCLFQPSVFFITSRNSPIG